MLKFISRNILTGLVTILPVALTLYLIYWMVVSTESLLGGIIKAIIPDILYFPGIGVIASLGVALMVGLLMRAYVVQQLFAKGEELLRETTDLFELGRLLGSRGVLDSKMGDPDSAAAALMEAQSIASKLKVEENSSLSVGIARLEAVLQ